MLGYHTSKCIYYCYHVTAINQHSSWKTGVFYWSRVLLPTCPCWRQVAHLDLGENARVLLNGVTCTLCVPSHSLDIVCIMQYLKYYRYHHHHNCFTALFLGPLGWAGARRELLDFIVHGKINRGRHIDYPAGRHSIRTNQCPPPRSPPHFFIGRMPFLPPNQQCQNTEGNLKYYR